jgi:hypothetical protein
MAENIENHAKDKKNVEWKLAELHTQVEALCAIVAQATKKSAVRAFMGRLFRWEKKEENQQLLRDGASIIAGLLGPAGGGGS